MTEDSRRLWLRSLLFACATALVCALPVVLQHLEFVRKSETHAQNALAVAADTAAAALRRGDYAGAGAQVKRWAEHHADVIQASLVSGNGFVLGAFTRDTVASHSLTLERSVVYGPAGHALLRVRINVSALFERTARLAMLATLVGLLLVAAFIHRLRDQRSRRHAAERLRWQSEALEQSNLKLHQAMAQRDIMERELQRERDRAQITLDALGDAVIRLDGNERIEFLNPAAESLTGWPRAQAIGQSLGRVVAVTDDQGRATPKACAALLRPRVGGTEKSFKLTLGRPGGGCAKIQCRVETLLRHDGRRSGSVLVLRDVTREDKLQNELRHRARHDGVTGLLNRESFEFALTRAVETARVDGRIHTLCYLDLDQFKVINDTRGHSAGDEMLRQLAELLRRSVRAQDTLARIGGDEFGLLLQDCPLNRGHEIAEEIRLSLDDFCFAWEDHTFSPTASVGLVEVSGAHANAATLLADADSACFAAKEQGRNRIHFFDPGDQELSRRRGEMQWATRLNQALRDDRFVLYGQSIVTVNGCEAINPYCEVLIRLREPDGRLTAPGVFLPAAERYDLIAKVDQWVVQRTFDLLARSAARGGALKACAINLSGASLSNAGLLEHIKRQIRTRNIPPQAVVFEITETAAVPHLSKVLPFMNELRELGCRFALDDFGTGLSSFSYLKTLPVDFLKIDGSFVRNLQRDPMDRALVAAIHEIGRVMGLETIAEYVEDASLLAELRDIGIDYAQGFGISRPRPLEDMLGDAAAQSGAAQDRETG